MGGGTARIHLKPIYALFSLLFASLAVVILFPARYTVQAQNVPIGDNFAGYAQLKHIASCESWGDPNKDPPLIPPRWLCVARIPKPGRYWPSADKRAHMGQNCPAIGL
jgi:hypothetical protein